MSFTTHPIHDPAVAARDHADVAAEFRALLSGCGVYDLRGRARIVLTGSDRVRWLNGMTTNNVRDLAAGQGVYAFVLNPQGHIQADLFAFQRGEHILVSTASCAKKFWPISITTSSPMTSKWQTSARNSQPSA